MPLVWEGPGTMTTNESLRLVGTSLKRPRRIALGGATVVAFTRGYDPAVTNQDGVACVDLGEGVLLALADGAGGLPGGQEAATIAIDAVMEAAHEVKRDGSGVQEAVLAAFDRANDRIRALAIGAASTLAVVIIEGSSLRSYHAGDSGVLVTGQRGRLRFGTVAHSPTGYAIEAGIMNEAQALRHAERHLISNVLGSDDMRIEIGPPIDLAVYDTAVLASDGLLDNLHSHEIAELARKGPLLEATERLCGLATTRMRAPTRDKLGKPDDLSVLLYRPRIC